MASDGLGGAAHRAAQTGVREREQPVLMLRHQPCERGTRLKAVVQVGAQRHEYVSHSLGLTRDGEQSLLHATAVRLRDGGLQQLLELVDQPRHPAPARPREPRRPPPEQRRIATQLLGFREEFTAFPCAPGIAQLLGELLHRLLTGDEVSHHPARQTGQPALAQPQAHPGVQQGGLSAARGPHQTADRLSR